MAERSPRRSREDGRRNRAGRSCALSRGRKPPTRRVRVRRRVWPCGRSAPADATDSSRPIGPAPSAVRVRVNWRLRRSGAQRGHLGRRPFLLFVARVAVRQPSREPRSSAAGAEGAAIVNPPHTPLQKLTPSQGLRHVHRLNPNRPGVEV
jgi:hypothetical protein